MPRILPLAYALVFTILGIACAAMAVQHRLAILFWPALSCAVLAFAYAADAPRLLGTRDDGRIAWWAWLVLGPYLLATLALWHVARLTGREPACHRVGDRLWLGRRPLPREVPPGVTTIIDLTAELPESRRVREGRRYFCIPTLDTGCIGDDALDRALAAVRDADGDVLIHCASGHGRSAMVAAAVLLSRGEAPSPALAEQALRSARSGVCLNRDQRRALATFATNRRATPPRVAEQGPDRLRNEPAHKES